MFNSRTLFILGVGASNEVELPLGSDLAKRIAKTLYFEFDFGRVKAGDGEFVDALRRHLGSVEIVNEHLRAARQITEGLALAESIDNYIDSFKEPKIEFCGKVAIAHEILLAESRSLIHPQEKRGRPWLDFDHLDHTWFNAFSKILFEGVASDTVNDVFGNISIISFNYDRCLEHYLIHALACRFNLDIAQSTKLVQELRILHPYGAVGSLWSSDALRFGGHDYSRLCGIAGAIRTYSEQVEDKAIVDELRGEVEDAETIVFLGFAFHPQNMSLIAQPSDDQAARGKRVFATAKGFSPDDITMIKKQIVGLFAYPDKVNSTTADEFFEQLYIRPSECGLLVREHRRGLSLI